MNMKDYNNDAKETDSETNAVVFAIGYLHGYIMGFVDGFRLSRRPRLHPKQGGEVDE